MSINWVSLLVTLLVGKWNIKVEYLRWGNRNVMDKAFYHAGDFIKFIIRLLSVWWPLFDVARAVVQLFRQSWRKWRK